MSNVGKKNVSNRSVTSFNTTNKLDLTTKK